MRRHGHLRWAAKAVLAAAALTVCIGRAGALTPESPEVKAAVAKAVTFLESDDANDTRLGARALVGLVLLKNGADAKHPKIAQAAEAIQRALGKLDPAQVKFDLYSTGLSIIFLVTLDPSKYQKEIVCMLESLKLRQKPHGGWGYPDKETGDTSMTQYGVLSSWEAAQAGFVVPLESIESVARWLLKTQDPSGGFGYQGKVAEGFTPVAQQGVRHSMTAAGLGSVYICADLLYVTPRAEQRDEDVPAALKEIKPKEAAEPTKPKTTLDPRHFREVETRGNHWMRANYDINPKQWTYYYLYALERCSSFRELAEGRSEKEPRWYTEGARFLIKTQADNGSWEGQAKATADTAFAALFLLRSTKKSIEKARNYGAGTMVVGRGLPASTAQVEVRMGRVVTKLDRSPADDLLVLLEHPEHADFDRALDALTELPRAEVEALVQKQGPRLRQMARQRSASARLAAVRALGMTRNLDYAPVLIRALADSDPQVVAEAREGLERLTRGGRAAAGDGAATEIERWKQWYHGIRPEVDLDN